MVQATALLKAERPPPRCAAEGFRWNRMQGGCSYDQRIIPDKKKNPPGGGVKRKSAKILRYYYARKPVCVTHAPVTILPFLLP